jgi:hypothetical protein
MHQPIDSSYDIKFVRLNTGEDLITEIIEVKKDDEAYYILRNPLKVLYMSSMRNSSALSISLMQWVFHRICEDQDFMIYPMDIVTMGKPSNSMLEYYVSSVDHFTSISDEYKKSMEFEKQKDDYLKSSIEEKPTEEGEGIDMLKEFMNRIKNNGKGTLH